MASNMVLISEKVQDIITHIQSELQSAIDEMAAYIESSIKALPTTAHIGMMSHLSLLSGNVQVINKKLDKYSLFDNGLHTIVADTDNFVEVFADRFLSWAHKKTVTVTEAMLIHKRSRSTIYRWIHSGKLNAIKEGRRWSISI